MNRFISEDDRWAWVIQKGGVNLEKYMPDKTLRIVSIPGKCAQYAQNRTLIPEYTLRT